MRGVILILSMFFLSLSAMAEGVITDVAKAGNGPVKVKYIIFEPVNDDFSVTSALISIDGDTINLLPDDNDAVIFIDLFEGTSKPQVLGLLRQLNNLFPPSSESCDSTAIIAKALRSMADLYGKDEEVLNELDALLKTVSIIEIPQHE
ncbi:MAG: hypothetical protein JKY93_12585 [Gammaproteobacteria bacterium]|nr:hypothetical protein [Gammaproteobacteria bacterium]